MKDKAKYNEYMREWMRKRSLARTPEEKAAFNARKNETRKIRMQNPDSLERRRKSAREYMRRELAKLTPEQRRDRSLCEIARKRAWREAHPEARKAEAREVYRRNSPHYREKRKAYGQRLKADVMSAYGGRCKCCGEDELVFLSIDHINGDGATHRRKELKESGMSFYVWLKSKGYPEGFQVLCMNCNTAKRTGGECPHRKIVMDRIFSLVKGGVT